MKIGNPLLIFIFTITSCNSGMQKDIQKKDHQIFNLRFSCSSEMKLYSKAGIDTNVFDLINQKNDTFHLEYGNRGIIDDLYTPSPPVFPISAKDSIVAFTGSIPNKDEVLFSEYSDVDDEQNIFDKNYILYDTINGIIAKIIQPKIIGNGMTGMYIPRLKNGKSFSIYAIDLDSSNHKLAIEMFKTFRYK